MVITGFDYYMFPFPYRTLQTIKTNTNQDLFREEKRQTLIETGSLINKEGINASEKTIMEQKQKMKILYSTYL